VGHWVSHLGEHHRSRSRHLLLTAAFMSTGFRPEAAYSSLRWLDYVLLMHTMATGDLCVSSTCLLLYSLFLLYCCPTHRLLAAVTSRLVGAAGAADEAAETAETTGAVAVSMALETEAATPEVEEVASATVAEEEAEVASGAMVELAI
jgi:hypothetical protein